MSCCTIKKEPKGPIKEVELLKKHFDEVLLEKKGEYQLLTLRDISPKPQYDYVVYLQVKIPYKDHNTHSGTTDEEYVEGVAKKILEYVELLKKESGKTKPKATLLFEDEEEELDKKAQLMKKYTFFELCRFTDEWYSYYEPYVIDSWIKQLPKNDKDMIELVKEAIVKATTSKDGYGRFDEFWWDDEYNYICRDGALSDIELINRVKQLIRLYLIPYKGSRYVNVYFGYDGHLIEEKVAHRFWFDGTSINGSSWVKCDRKYDLYDKEFIFWLREYFNVAHKEVISDTEILKENIKIAFYRAYGYENPEFDAIKEINEAKSLKEFKAKVLKAKTDTFVGGSGYSVDGFRASVDIDYSSKRSCIVIAQSRALRESLSREVDSLKPYEFGDEDMAVVYSLSFIEVLEKAYELFRKETKPIQTTLFDFLAA